MSILLTPVKGALAVVNKYTRTDLPGQLLDNGSQSAFLSLGVANRKELNPNPNWKALVARHIDASGNYRRIEQKYQGSFASVHGWGYPVANSKLVTSECYAYGTWFQDPSQWLDFSSDSSLQGLALQRLKQKITSAANITNALIPLVELHELRGTLAQLMNFTSDTLVSVMSARGTKGKSVARQIANTWLLWSFGIKPMLNDIKSISASINEMINGVERNIVLRGSAKKFWVSKPSGVGGFAPFGSNYKSGGQCAHELSYHYTAGLNLNVRSANNYGVSSQLGVNLQGLPSVLWELTAFSWCIDYFANVGSYLDDVFNVDANQTIYCNLETKYKMQATWSFDPQPAQPSVQFYNVKVVRPGNYEYNEFVRTPYGSKLPSTNLRIRSIDEVGKNASNKLANLMSVYAGKLKLGRYGTGNVFS